MQLILRNDGQDAMYVIWQIVHDYVMVWLYNSSRDSEITNGSVSWLIRISGKSEENNFQSHLLTRASVLSKVRSYDISHANQFDKEIWIMIHDLLTFNMLAHLYSAFWLLLSEMYRLDIIIDLCTFSFYFIEHDLELWCLFIMRYLRLLIQKEDDCFDASLTVVWENAH